MPLCSATPNPCSFQIAVDATITDIIVSVYGTGVTNVGLSNTAGPINLASAKQIVASSTFGTAFRLNLTTEARGIWQVSATVSGGSNIQIPASVQVIGISPTGYVNLAFSQFPYADEQILHAPLSLDKMPGQPPQRNIYALAHTRTDSMQTSALTLTNFEVNKMDDTLTSLSNGAISTRDASCTSMYVSEPFNCTGIWNQESTISDGFYFSVEGKDHVGNSVRRYIATACKPTRCEPGGLMPVNGLCTCSPDRYGFDCSLMHCYNGGTFIRTYGGLSDSGYCVCRPLFSGPTCLLQSHVN